MTPVLLTPGVNLDALAAIHAESFSQAWNARALADLLATPGAFACAVEGGFVMVRAVAGEAEILTIAVRPDARRRGAGAALVRYAAEHAQSLGAGQMFLEVALGNLPARALYGSLGFAEVGRRGGYYALGQGKFEDALILRSNLPLSGLGNRPASG